MPRLFYVRVTAAACLLLCTVQAVMAYGSEGHRAIGEAARTLLNARAKAHIAQILGSDDLAAVSTWADDVRAASRGYGPLVDNAEAARFNAEFPGNAGWHFADIPLGESDYTDNDPFSKSMDVVHVINLCIRSLEGDSSALKGATRNQALDLLVHFVGDVHQPLHVGEGFYRLDDPNSPILIQDPHQATGLPDDRGGNALYFTRSKELHAMWDTDLVADACGSTDSHVLARAVEADVARHRVKTPGDYHRWAEAWASDSLAAARGAYAGITFGPATVEKRGRIRRIEITLPPDYEKEQSKTVLRELSKAAWRLADLLNAIAWK